MTDLEIIEIVRQAILLTIQISLAPMLVGLGVGIVIALFQALTQIQEITLVFVPKIIAIFATIFVFFPGMSHLMNVYMEQIADKITSMG